MAKWGVLAVLGAAQFLMVLDQAVMNVAISQLVEDFDTTVTTIQVVIAFYALVMAALMVTGGKLGDLWGRRRAFTVGLVIYGAQQQDGSPYFKIREENVYRKVRHRMAKWLGEVF